MVQVREAVWRRRAGWWTRNRDYLLFQLRELGGALTAVYGIILLGLLINERAGPGAYAAYLAFLQTPLMLVVQGLLLAFILVHAVTWFFLIGRTQQVMSKARRPWQTVFVGNLVIFAVVSAGVAFLIFGWRFF